MQARLFTKLLPPALCDQQHGRCRVVSGALMLLPAPKRMATPSERCIHLTSRLTCLPRGHATLSTISRCCLTLSPTRGPVVPASSPFNSIQTSMPKKLLREPLPAPHQGPGGYDALQFSPSSTRLRAARVKSVPATTGSSSGAKRNSNGRTRFMGFMNLSRSSRITGGEVRILAMMTPKRHRMFPVDPDFHGTRIQGHFW